MPRWPRAAELGRSLARAGVGVVFGGGHVGLMGAVADAALAEGGGTRKVVGPGGCRRRVRRRPRRADGCRGGCRAGRGRRNSEGRWPGRVSASCSAAATSG